MRSRHRCTKAYGAILIGREMHDNHVIGIACEIFTRVLDTAHRVRCLCYSGLEVEFAAVIRGTLVRSRNHEVAHRLETCRTWTNHVLAYNGFCSAVIATPQGVTGVFQVVCSTLLIVVARAARPNSTFVKTDVIFFDATINEATHVAVTNRERVRKFRTCIAVVPKCKRIVRCCKSA